MDEESIKILNVPFALLCWLVVFAAPLPDRFQTCHLATGAAASWTPPYLGNIAVKRLQAWISHIDDTAVADKL